MSISKATALLRRQCYIDWMKEFRSIYEEDEGGFYAQNNISFSEGFSDFKQNRERRIMLELRDEEEKDNEAQQ